MVVVEKIVGGSVLMKKTLLVMIMKFHFSTNLL